MATETLSSMDMKVRELLKEVELDYSPAFTRLVDDAISSIKSAINKIPEDLRVTSDFAPGFVRDIGADKVEFKFKKPELIELGGSYAMHCVAKPDVNIDLFVRMPKECFYEKDYINYRYHAKRCLYLSVIKKYLELSSGAERVEWSSFQNEARKPILVIYPATVPADSPSFSLSIIPTATAVFNISKLKLNRNNVRALNEVGDVLQPTPKYNSSILEDMVMEENAAFFVETFLGWKSLGEALILLKVWARQRSSIYLYDCLNGFLLSAIMAYLTSKSGGNRISNSMSTLQIFRVTMDFIANSKLWENGLLFESQSEGKVSAKERRMSLKSFPVAVCGPFADFNLTFRMTRNGFIELREEAALTLSFLDKCKDGGFEEVFMTKIDFPAKYDHCIRLNLKGNSEVRASGFCLDDECWRLYEQKVLSLVHQGLTDRIKFIRVIWRNTSRSNLEDGLTSFDREPLLIGISVSTIEKAFRIVDIGPDAENKDEALKYRKFWGDKAELRRFKDGRISESTVWECKQWERHLIIKRIIEYVLVRHFSISKDNIIAIVDQLDFSLLYGTQEPTVYSVGLLEAFDTLSKHLRLLSDLPLRVTSVQPLDSAFRFTSVFPPEPHPLAVEKITNKTLNKHTSSCIQPLEVMIQLEGSGNWPMDDVVIEKTKSAFLLQMGESLQNNLGMTCNATADDVVVFSSGYAFRLKILHERSVNLIKRQIGNQMKQSISADQLLFYRSQHSSMINGLQGRFPIYGPVVRLAKRWIAAHMFSTSLTEEAIELLVAYLFMRPLPFQAPCSRITGFLRFLRLLTEYDWAFSPLIVDINGDMKANDETEINENFMLSRNRNSGNSHNISPAMFLAASYDKASEAWTGSLPTSLELKRLAAYAKSSETLLAKLISQDQPDSYRWECLFRTPLSNYDAVVLLHRDKLPYPQRLLFPSEMSQGKQVVRGKASKAFRPFLLPGDMKGTSQELKNKLMVDFDPLKCFIRDLEKEFPDIFKVWFDSLGGDAIGLTWERSGSKKRGREEGEEERDPLDILKTAGEVGKGIVRSVHLLKAPRLSS